MTVRVPIQHHRITEIGDALFKLDEAKARNADIITNALLRSLSHSILESFPLLSVLWLTIVPFRENGKMVKLCRF